MASYARVSLSGSTLGQAINVTASQGIFTTVHTGGTATTVIDEVYLWAQNNYSKSVDLIVYVGGNSGTATIITQPITPGGLEQVLPGLSIIGQASATIQAAMNYAGSSSDALGTINLFGHVNRITN